MSQNPRTVRAPVSSMVLGTAVVGLMTLASITPALACPACAAGRSGGIGTLALIGAMIAVPYVVGVITYAVLRRAQASPASSAQAETAHEVPR